jgi:hypothetical protein
MVTANRQGRAIVRLTAEAEEWEAVARLLAAELDYACETIPLEAQEAPELRDLGMEPETWIAWAKWKHRRRSK